MTPEQKDYLYSESYVEGARCLELELPWMVPEAIEKIEENISRSDIVFEMGCGGSTLFFARRCQFVKYGESDLNWMHKVMSALLREKLYNNYYGFKQTEEDFANFIKQTSTNDVTVFSVDTQGGEIDRSNLLNAFLDKGISSNLRIIILDNYAHEGLFPLHYYRVLDLGDDWEVFTYDHPRWAGEGTRIYIKKQNNQI